ncbi:MAG TPA: VIT1/CCC1 transporter family protein, partial [Vicinamibacterales bacterium]|nr:VIT1/CCC1 transporter family protein [Vicinamibacterales bacterium]
MTADAPPPADESWDHHYADERDAAWLYRELAKVDPVEDRRDLFARLAVVEDQHVARWEELFAAAGRPLPRYSTSTRTRVLAWVARTFGPSSVLPLILAEEGREVQAYLGLARESSHHQTHKAAVDIASDSAVHARELAEVMGREGEPWHVGGAGGLLRSIVYGFNDGLTANFGLVAGVLGADVPSHIVIISGIAGCASDALSMGSSGYLAAKSEAEVQAHQIEMERREMRLMPDLEEQELVIIYEAKGLTPERARETAKAMMADPARALETQVREELNIHPAELAPLKDGLVTGIATFVGAFIPIAPFLMMEHARAVWVSLV